MTASAVVMGIGEMGSVFARALLRSGHPVVPVNRGMDPAQVAKEVPEPVVVMVTVGEGDLAPALEGMPPSWRDRICLVQNELHSRDWQRFGIEDPTVAVVWFEKKPAKPLSVVRPTVIAGPSAELLCDALGSIGIDATGVPSGEPLRDALALKNLYILTSNIAGLEVGGTTGELWRQHRDLAEEVAREVLTLEEGLFGATLPRDPLLAELGEAFLADPAHGCTGRSAPLRLARAVRHADDLGLSVPRLRALSGTYGTA